MNQSYGFVLHQILWKFIISYDPCFNHQEIWDALRAAAEADINLAQAIVDSAGIIVHNADLTVCYDERGGYAYILSSYNFWLFNYIIFYYL